MGGFRQINNNCLRGAEHRRFPAEAEPAFSTFRYPDHFTLPLIFVSNSSAIFVGSVVFSILIPSSDAKSQMNSIHWVNSSQALQSPPCSYQTCMPCFSETKMYALVWNGMDRPNRTPRSISIFSIWIRFARAMSRRADSIFPSMECRALETACREMPRRLAIAIFAVPLRRIVQNANHFSSTHSCICYTKRVD